MKARVRVLLFMLCIIMVLGLLPVQAFAATVVASGYCGGEGDGTNLSWTLDSDGVLTISGQGAMADYKSDESTPWYSQKYRNPVRKLIVENGVTSIGNYALDGCYSLEEAMLPNGLTRIGDVTFGDCRAIESILFFGFSDIYLRLSQNSQSFSRPYIALFLALEQR